MQSPPVWPWFLAGGALLALAIFIIFIILPTITLPVQFSFAYGSPAAPPPTPPGGCQCYSDVWARSPVSAATSPEYSAIEARDNKTFCGFEKEGYRWGCKPSDCTPACG